MSLRLWLNFIVLIFILPACGGGGSDTPTLTCTLPCLAESPTISETSVMSANGGTVTVEFKLTNDAENVVIILMSDELLNLNTAGTGTLFNVQGGVYHQLDLVVNAGTVSGTYYPNISVTANQLNSGSIHYLDPTKSNSKYTYNEVIQGNAGIPALRPYSIPKLTVN